MSAAASPCVGVCRLDLAAGHCVGCGRTGDEIGRWRAADEADRRSILAAIPDRLAARDVPPAPLDLEASTIAERVREALRRGDGTFVVGCHGAVAEFMAAPGETPAIEASEGRVVARVADGRFRIDLPADVSAFRLEDPAARGPTPILLAARAAGRALPPSRGLARLGADPAPIAPDDADGVLFDVGLGFAETRFMVRTADAALLARLDALAGAPLDRLLEEAGGALLAASPTRVVETPLARAEVDGPIPPPAGRSPIAPHTHLLPGPLALGRLMPPGVAVPAGLVPIALHYPGPAPG